MLQGLLHLSLLQEIIVFLIATHITTVGVSVYLHRCQAHRALDMNPVLAHFFRLYLWLTTGVSTRAWVAIHRKHHATCETIEDPHSPQILGLRKVLLEGAELYRKEAKNSETMERFSKGTPNDWLENKVYGGALGVSIMAVIDLLLFGVHGITFWALQMMWIPFWAAGVVNGVGHYLGYRNFEIKDASRNISPWGILMAGEELHNNHHTFPNSAKLSVKRWEFDISWLYIRILSALHLVKVNRTAPVPFLMSQPKAEIDVQTIQAIVQCRYDLLSRYAREVLKPVLRSEWRKGLSRDGRLFKQCRAILLGAPDMALDQTSQSKLESLLKSSRSLEKAYQMRAKLLALWENHSASPRELVDALREWCKQAETSGIETLARFAEVLKRYNAKVLG